MARPRRERPRRRWIRTLEGCETTVGCGKTRRDGDEREEGRRSVSCVRVPARVRALCHFTELHKARHARDLARSASSDVLYFVLALAPASLAAAKCTMSPSAIA